MKAEERVVPVPGGIYRIDDNRVCIIQGYIGAKTYGQWAKFDADGKFLEWVGSFERGYDVWSRFKIEKIEETELIRGVE